MNKNYHINILERTENLFRSVISIDYLLKKFYLINRRISEEMEIENLPNNSRIEPLRNLDNMINDKNYSQVKL